MTGDRTGESGQGETTSRQISIRGKSRLTTTITTRKALHSTMSPEKPAIAGNDVECAVVTADESRAGVSPPPYSAFTPSQKRWIVFLAALAGMFSPMSSFIFYPAINSIAHSLDVTVGLVNLAITTYMVVSGVTPALLGNAADKIGRRPVYLLALGLYFVANIGLALQSDFAALLVLRMVQSAGSSGTCSVFSGFMVRCLVDRAYGAQSEQFHWVTVSSRISRLQPREVSMLVCSAWGKHLLLP